MYELTTDGGATQGPAGDWLVRTAGHGEWRTVADRALDDSGWQATVRPGRWWLDTGFEDEPSVLYRRRFALPSDATAAAGPVGGNGTRWWLAARSLCELGHLWLDGTYLGDLRGRHTEHAFEVTRLLRSDSLGTQHLLAVEAAQGAVRVPQHHDAHVRIERTGPARIGRVRVLVIEASLDRAVLRINATVDSSGTHRGKVTITVVPADHAATAIRDIKDSGADASKRSLASSAPTADAGEIATLGDGLAVSEQVLARGRNELEWLVALEQPALWWPSGMGEQSLYRVEIDVAIDGRSSHAVRLPTGIRTVSHRRGRLAVNGERLRGGRGVLRVAEHELSHPGIYESANAVGELLCQQIALEPAVFAGPERGMRALATRAAAAAADHAGHHPSVVAWQPIIPSHRAKRALWATFGRSWANRAARHAMRTADPTRPQI